MQNVTKNTCRKGGRHIGDGLVPGIHESRANSNAVNTHTLGENSLYTGVVVQPLQHILTWVISLHSNIQIQEEIM